jgi:general secretion pathway protein A
MYQNYWNLREKPFRNTADKKFFLYAPTYEEAYVRLLYSVTESQGLFMLMGEGGCGKSLLCKLFCQDLLEQGYRVAAIANPTLNAEEFVQMMLLEFGIPCSNLSKLGIYREFRKLSQENKDEKGYVLVVDEAHLLTDMGIFQEIRLLLNLESNNRFFITPILLGKPELTGIVSKSALKDRISLQYQIQPLNCRETGEYIYYRLNKAGAAREIFTVDAIKEVYIATQGIPREINNLCDVALLLGYAENSITVDANLARKAVADLRGNKVNLAANPNK